MGTTGDIDVLIVGGRVAGSITGSLLADLGHRVVIIDKATLPSPTISTHFFRGEWCGQALDDLGVLEEVLAAGAPRLVRQFRHSSDSDTPEESPAQLPGALGFSLSVRRETLDGILIRRAQKAGVEVRPPAKVTGLIRSDDRVTGVELEDGSRLEAGIVVGADGRRSILAAQLGAEEMVSVPPLRALYYRYMRGWQPPEGDVLDAAEFSFVDDEVGYVFPSDGDVACVALSLTADRYQWFKSDLQTHFAERLDAHPGFAARYRAAEPASRLYGTSPEPNWVRQPTGAGWALVGDAGVHQDPVAGLGIDSAALQARALADSLHSWLSGDVTESEAMASYAARRDEVAIPLFNASCGLA